MDWFAVSNDKQLKALGLEGPHVFCLITNRTLELRGETAGNVFFTPDQIRLLRIGFYETRSGRFYQAKLWTPDSGKPVVLQATRASWHGYSRIITQWVEIMSANNRRDCVETGSSKFDAILGPALMAIPTLGALIVSVFVITNEPWWGRLLVPLVPTIIFAILAWMGVKRYWPRVLRSTEQLNPQLPPIN